MTQKKAPSQGVPQASAPGTDAPLAPLAPQVSAPRQRKASAVKKSQTPAPTSPASKKRTPAAKVQTAADPADQALATKTSSRSAARSSARAPAPTQTRKPSRVKTKALPATADQPQKIEPVLTDDALGQDASAAAPIKPSDRAATEKPAPEAAAPAMLSVAELWEQGSPIRTRIAQLRTRNSLLEEQLQRLRPPVQVRGKKK